MKGRYPTQGDLTLWSDGSSALSNALPVGLFTGMSSNNVLTRKHISASASLETQAHTPWVFGYLLLFSYLQPPVCRSGDNSVRGPCFPLSSSVSPFSSTCRWLVRGVAHGCPFQRLGFRVFSRLPYLHHPPIFTGDLEVLPSLYWWYPGPGPHLLSSS